MDQGKRTRIHALGLGLVEAGLIASIVSVPLFVNYYSRSVFEQDKAALLVALSCLVALGGVVAVVEAQLRPLIRGLRRPLVVTGLGLVASATLATLASELPRVSLWGSYDRGQGLVVGLAYAVVFMGAAAVGRRPEGRRRIVAAVAAVTGVAALVTLLQAAGYEPVPGDVQAVGRYFGSFSNPIFLGAALMVGSLAALGIAGDAWSRRRRGLAFAAVAIVALQVVAMALSASRGPILGLGTGLVAMVAAYAALRRRRLIAVAMPAVVVLGLAGLYAMNLPDSPLAPMAEVPVVGRFAEIGATATGSQATRLRIWEKTTELLSARELRASSLESLLLGSGPETFKYALAPYGEVGAGAESGSLADRAHNVLLDALVTTGILGGLALVAFFVAWMVAAAQNLGLGLRGRAWLVLSAGPVLGGVAGMIAWTQRPALGAALVLLGIPLGFLVSLSVAAWRATDEPDEAEPRWSAAALVGVAVAVAVEAAFGIWTTGPSILFWALAGLVAVRASSPVYVEARDATPAVPRGGRTSSGEITLAWNPSAGATGLVFGLAAALVLYGSLAAPASARPPGTLAAVALIVAGVLVGAVFVGRWAESAGSGSTAVAALAVVGGYLLLRIVILAPADPVTLLPVTIWFLVMGVLLAAPGFAPARGEKLWSWPAGVLYPVGAAVAVAAIQFAAVRPVQADVLFQSAVANFQAAIATDDPSRFSAAQELHARAVRLRPDEAHYYSEWARLYSSVGEASLADVQAAATAFQEAQTLLTRAQQLEPGHPYHAYNRGNIQLAFAQTLPEGQQQQVGANAAEALRQAFDLAPTDPQIARSLAQAHLLADNFEAARSMAEYLLSLRPNNPANQLVLGHAYAELGNVDAAEQAYQEALQLERPGAASAEPYVALGELAREQGDLMAARNWYSQGVSVEPENWVLHYNLGLLYRDTGSLQEAITELSMAASVAPPEQRATVQQALDNLMR